MLGGISREHICTPQVAVRSMSVAAPPQEAELVLRGDIQLGESPYVIAHVPW